MTSKLGAFDIVLLVLSMVGSGKFVWSHPLSLSHHLS